MAAATALAIGGLALGAIGAGVAYKGSQQAARASKKAEGLRKKQANLDIARARRERIREAIIARSYATSTAANQGAVNSSALPGTFSQYTSRLGQNVSGLAQNQFLGNQIFGANANIASAQSLTALGEGFGNLGNSLFNVSSSPLFRTA